jgi:3-hydroxyacyl-CoA dehydrogenase / enoyl-CoA hydratase / 3-hydroxybutyryl-CoA epimerase / enoyl-CoA isomerase
MIYQTQSFTVQEIGKGIVELQFDCRGSVNLLNIKTLKSFDKALSIIQGFKNLKGLLISSNKSGFIAGADITEFLTLFDCDINRLDSWLKNTNSMLTRLEQFSVPTLSMLRGHTLGGGCEIALATDFRLSDATTIIGLPEVNLGIMPGFGGTVRLPRIIGIERALNAITSATLFSAKQALEIGLIDSIEPSAALYDQAINQLLTAKCSPIWQKKRDLKRAAVPLTNNQSLHLQTQIAQIENEASNKRQLAVAISAVSIGKNIRHTSETALDIERQSFLSLAQSKQAKALVRVYLNEQFHKRKTEKSISDTLQKNNSLTVIGAGMLGSTLSFQAALAGYNVRLNDSSPALLNAAITQTSQLFNQAIYNKRITEEQANQLLSAITPQITDCNVEENNLVIETSIANPQDKVKLIRDIEQQIAVDTIIASNNSIAPIAEISSSMLTPERFCGIHFFNPIHRMPLVEIIRGPETSQDTINQLVRFTTQLNKIPLVVNDGPGFFINRILYAYFKAFTKLLVHGIDFTHIDRVMEQQFGWQMGPAAVLDLIGIDTAYQAHQIMREWLSNKNSTHPSRDDSCILQSLYEQKILGRATGEGFYKYRQDNKDQASDTTLAIIKRTTISKDSILSDHDITQRLMIPLANEVCRCLEEKIITSPQEADIALIYGLGFPREKAGIFHYLDNFGINNYLTMIKNYEELGYLYKAPQLLINMVKNNQLFYPIKTNPSCTNLEQ